jgi:hypothetical protein
VEVPKLEFIKAERISLAGHPELDEKWVQARIAEDPSIVGLGDLVLPDRERIQPRARRLDLLLQDPETLRRYEVELQLGKTDETHIIRTIEYWDIERKRYPQYDHCAVLVAEDITSRFLNIISLFNGSVPLIAIQMAAFQIGEGVVLTFTTVVDELERGLVDEDEVPEVADRAYWENRGNKATVAMADELLELIHQFAPGIELKYNRHYIGLAKNGQPYNFAIFRARKNSLNLDIKLPPTDEYRTKLEEAGLELMEYDKRWGAYRVRLAKGDIKGHSDLIRALLEAAYEWRQG